MLMTAVVPATRCVTEVSPAEATALPASSVNMQMKRDLSADSSNRTAAFGWLCGTAVERRSFASELSCPALDL